MLKKEKYLRDYIENWLNGIKISCKQSTYTHYQYVISKRILPPLGNLKEKQITSKEINNYTWSLYEEGLSTKTIKDILTILKQILNYSHIYIDINMPKIKKKDIQVITYQDQEKLERFLLDNINEITVGIYLCLYTGLRIGEICALKWKNIDLEKKIINIENTLIRVKEYDSKSVKKTKVILDEPKSLASIRQIPIPYCMIPILKKFQTNKEYFFLTSNAKFIEPRTYNNHYQNLLHQIPIERHYNFHALRHTFATHCIELGSDPKTLSEILGHANVKITLDRYVHPNFATKIRMMNKLCPMIKNFSFPKTFKTKKAKGKIY